MLRAYDERGGVGVYTRNITRQLVNRAPGHQFFLYFANLSPPAEFADCPNATTRTVQVGNKAIWDQVCMPYWFRKDRLDVIFHPKFTVPLLCKGRSVMVLHGAGWFIPETRRFWSRATRIYARLMMPVYCRSAGAVLSVSSLTRDVFIERLSVAPDKIRTVYPAPGAQFSAPCRPEDLARVRDQYCLPAEFILTLSGADRDTRKNFEGVLEAFKRVHIQRPCKLVVVGRDCEQFRDRYRIPATGYGADIVFTGWVEQADLPVFYRLAALFLYPSNMESFPIPVTEALACGTAVVTSNLFGLREIAGDGAVLVAPSRPDEIAEAVLALLTDDMLRQQVSERAVERARQFTWDNCAGETLRILEKVGAG